MDELIQFHWERSPGGYQTARGILLGHEEPLLIRKTPVSEEKGRIIYFPLEESSGLFREFASLEPTPSAVVNFANRFGFLGSATWASVADYPVAVWGESLGEWFSQIEKMKCAFGVWNLAKENKTASLAHAVSIKSHTVDGLKETFYTIELSVDGYTCAVEINPETSLRFKSGDLLLPARCAVQQIVNEELTKSTCAQLLWDSGWTNLRYYVKPAILLGAMWLQFASAISRNPLFTQCKECGDWFELSRDVGARTDKLYHSNACRVKAYRKRKETRVKTRRIKKVSGKKR